MKKYSDVVIIGAGASGLMCAALLAGDKNDYTITILEKNTKIGKKLAATGNGRCNFTNLHISTECYYADPNWINKVLDNVSPVEVIEQFAKLGVLHRERDGYVYPHTNQAGTVVRALEQACIQENIRIELDCFVKSFHKKSKKTGFEVVTTKGTILCQILVVATGGRANKETGGDASGYEMVKKLGLFVTPLYPGLTGLICPGRMWKNVAGTRIQGAFSLKIDESIIHGETGEIQIVKDGVSGIPVFQLCRFAAEAIEKQKKVYGIIDFVPSLSVEELDSWMGQHGLQGIVPEKWLSVLEGKTANEIKNYTFTVSDTFGIDRAQVTAGGVALEQVNCSSMEVKDISNLFLLGEVLDVDGICGGYNLHFAWASAILAAQAMKERLKEHK